MKHMLFFLVLLLSVSLSAQQTDSLFHKYQMIDAINRGEYSNAANLILQDTATIIPAIQYLDSIGLEKEKTDSISEHVMDSLSAIGMKYYKRNEYEESIKYYKLALSLKELFNVFDENYLIFIENIAELYLLTNDYLQSEKYYLKALEKCDVIDNCWNSTVSLAYIYYLMGDFDSAISYYLEALSIRKSLLGDTHPDYAILLNNLGNLYYTMGDYSKAEPYYLEALSIRKSVLGESHPDYATSLHHLGDLYSDMGDYSKAEPYYLEALSIRKSVLGDTHPDYATSLNNLGALYSDMGDYSKAELYYLESLRIDKSVLGESHPDYAISLNNLGSLYYTMGDYSKAEQYLLEALSIRKSVLGESHPDYATSLNNLGNLYYNMGDYSKAEPYYLEAMNLYKSVLGDTHPDYAISLNNLGDLYSNMGYYSKAEPYYLEAMNLYKSVLGDTHPDYAISLNNLGDLYSNMGYYSKAEPYYLEAMNLYKSVLGDTHPDYAISLNNLGDLYSNMGDYSKAEPYYLEALSIRKSVLGETHPNYATSLGNLGTLYSNMGDYSKAELYYLESLRIRKSVFGENHPNYAILLNNLGGLYCDIGDYSKAEQYLLEALSIRKSVLGESHPSYAISLDNLGLLYIKMGDYSKAEQYLLEAFSICKSVLGESHPDYATSLNNLGNLYYTMGDYSKAEQYLLEALSIRKSVLGESHPDYATSLGNLGTLYSNMGDYAKAEPYYLDAAQITKNLFLRSTTFMTEQQREDYWSTIQGPFTRPYVKFSYKYYNQKPSISTFAYNNELFVKGLLLKFSESVKRSIIESNDTVLIRQWNELTTKKQQIQVLQEKEPQSNYLKQIEAEAEQLEKQITRSSAAFREHQAMWQITWDSVRNHLSPNEVAIEYFSAPLSKDSTMYCALLLRHDSEHPELIPLFEQKEIISFMSHSSRTITNQTYDFYSKGDTISQLVWSKILPNVKEGETIYFAPSGLLHQLAIEYLPYDEDRTMSDVYNMVRLSSTREIVMNKPQLHNTTATIYGGITYDIDATSMLDESRAYDSADLLASRSLENDTLNRGTAQYLLGTKIEAEHINTLLQENSITAQLYTTTKANEESFKALSGKHNNILHIGTHGFTWTDSTAQKQDYFTQRMQMQLLGEEHRHHGPIIDPLNRCGLLFAGANMALQGNSRHLPEGVQDGILTAKEISLMDLRDANLVVLSACETAKGDITSEGVFGLQRAFKMAGVQTIIMSLWKVSDQATQLLMTEFYNNWIGKHQSKREAFRNAQNTVRTQYEEPEFWAGFIMLD